MHRLTLTLLAFFVSAVSLSAQIARDLPDKIKKGAKIDSVADDIVSFFGYELLAEREALAATAGTIEDPAKRLKVFAAIALADPQSAPLQKELARLISDRKEKHAARLIRLCALCSDVGEELLQALTLTLKRGDVDERFEAAQALGRLGPISPSVLDALEDALDERDELVLVQVARAYARCAPDEARLEKLRERVLAGKGSKLRTAILVLGQLGDRSILEALVPLSQTKSVDAESLWAIGQICARHKISLGAALKLFGVEDFSTSAAVNRALELLAVGVAASAETEQLFASGRVPQNELSLAASLSVGRRNIDRVTLKGEPEDRRWYALALTQDAAANAELNLPKTFFDAPFDDLWRAEVELESAWLHGGERAPGSRRSLALNLQDPVAGRLLYSRFVGGLAGENKTWPALTSSKLVTTPGAAWLALRPILHDDPELPLDAAFQTMLEHVGPDDQLLIEAAQAFTGESTTSFKAARRVLQRYLVSSLNQPLASELRKGMTKVPALRVSAIHRNSTWMLDSTLRRFAIVGALAPQPLAASGLWPMLTEWLEFEVDPELRSRLVGLLFHAGASARTCKPILQTTAPDSIAPIERMRKRLAFALEPAPEEFLLRLRALDQLRNSDKLEDPAESHLLGADFESLLVTAPIEELQDTILKMSQSGAGQQILEKHIRIVLRIAPQLLEKYLKQWSNENGPMGPFERPTFEALLLHYPERFKSLDLKAGPYQRMIREGLAVSGQGEDAWAQSIAESMNQSNQPGLLRYLLDAGLDSSRVLGKAKAIGLRLGDLETELAIRGGELSRRLLLKGLQEFYTSPADEQPDFQRLQVLSSAARAAVAANQAGWRDFLKQAFREDLPSHLLWPIIWAIPHHDPGSEVISDFRRSLLIDGGDADLMALAAYTLAQAATEEDLPALEAALLSEFATVAQAACAGIESAAQVHESLAELICENTTVQGTALAAAALRALLRFQTLPDTVRQAVVLNLAEKSPRRRMLAARLLPRLTGFTVAEIDAISTQLVKRYRYGDTDLVFGLCRLERPDPRLRSRLELKRVAERIDMRATCSAALAWLFPSHFADLADEALSELLHPNLEFYRYSALPVDGQPAFSRTCRPLFQAEYLNPLPTTKETPVFTRLYNLETERGEVRGFYSTTRSLPSFLLDLYEKRDVLSARALKDLERFSLICWEEDLSARAAALVAKHKAPK